MKLNEVFKPIFEETYKEIRDVSEYKALIKDYLEKGNFIYRGMKNTGKVILGSSSGLTRPRMFKDNIINTYVDSLSTEWGKYPKRDGAFICSTSKGDTIPYGETYYVIPLNNPDIAICPKYDFWFSFDMDVPSLSKTVSVMATLLDAKNNTTTFDENDIVTPDKLRHIIKLIDANMDAFDISQFTGNTNWSFRNIEKLGGLQAALEKCFKPTNFEIKKLDQVGKTAGEVWFEGDAIFVNEKTARSSIL